MAKKENKKKKQLIEDGFIIENPNYLTIADSRIKPIIGWLREGKTDYEIILLILELFKVKESSANTYLRSAKSCFKEEMILERKFNIIQHVKRYDRDIFKLANLQPKTDSYSQSLFLKGQAYSDMVTLLQRKEKVLGFHQKSTSIKIKNNVNIKMKTLKRSFTFNDLSNDEKLELFKLIEKTKITDTEKYSIKPNPNKNINTKNIEEASIENDNISQTNVDEIKIVPVPPIPEPIINNKIAEDKNIIDTVGESKQGKTLDSVTANILNNLLKK